LIKLGTKLIQQLTKSHRKQRRGKIQKQMAQSFLKVINIIVALQYTSLGRKNRMEKVWGS